MNNFLLFLVIDKHPTYLITSVDQINNIEGDLTFGDSRSENGLNKSLKGEGFTVNKQRSYLLSY